MTARATRALIVAIALGLALTPAVLAQSPESTSETRRFVDVEVTPDDLVAGQVANVRFSIEDEDGEPMSGLRASARLREPSTAYDDAPPSPTLTTIGRELAEPGRYEVSVALNQSGRWWIELQVEDRNRVIADHDHFAVVDPSEDATPASTDDPVFLRSNEWDAYFRIDPHTGSVATLDGDEIFAVEDRWWVADIVREPLGTASNEFGGTWRLTFVVRDAMTGDEIASIEVGELRANVYPGSQHDPAIATSISVAPDGSAIYLYWARQLGEGWVGNVAVADPETGELRSQRVLNGAIVSNGFWAEIYPLDDQRLAVAEQVVELASVSGYRLTVLDRETLEIDTQFRRTDAREDPLTHCMLTYPGPVGHINGDGGNRYSLCSPPGSEHELSLVVWDPATARATHTIGLEDVASSATSYTDGVASPDGTVFYAVNSRTLELAEIDMVSGEVLRETSLLDDADPSTLDRFFEWFFGAWQTPAAAAGIVKPAVTIDPAGETLYMISQPENREPSVLVVDLDTLEVENRLLPGEDVDGVLATPDGRIAVVTRDGDVDGDTVKILDGEGSTNLSFTLPGRSDVVGSRR